MTFETQKVLLGRIPVTVLEMDMDFCGRTYGLGSCEAGIVNSGTTDALSTTTDIILAVDASDEDDFYNGMNIKVNGEERIVSDYVGNTKTATVSPAFTVSVTSQAYTLHDINSPNACYNTLVSCQDVPNFQRQSKTYRFISERSGLPDKHPLWVPCLQRADQRPTILTDDRTLGIRAQATVRLRDFASTDTEFGQDKYFANRNFDPVDQGTFFGKFRRRNEFYINRPARLKFGYIPWRQEFTITFSDAAGITNYGDSTVTLGAAASSNDGEYIGQSIILTGVADVDRARGILAYDGTTKVATVSRAYSVGSTASTAPYRIVETEDGLPLELPDFDNDFEVNEYVIDRFEGPDTRGNFNIVLKDPLRLAENDRAIAPVPTNAVLSADLNNSATSFTLIGDPDQFPATGTLQINDEQMTFTKGTTTDNSMVMNVVRNVNGSDAQEHSEDDNAQNCYVTSGTNVVDILTDLLTNFAGIDSAFIPTSEWTDVKNSSVSGNNYTVSLGQPTGVGTLVSELVEENLLALWFETETSLIKLASLIPAQVEDLPILNDNANFVKDSFRSRDAPKDRLSRVQIIYGKRNQALEVEPGNARFSYIADDASAQSAEQYGDLRIHTRESRWMTELNNAQAIDYCEKLLARYRKIPIDFQFDMDFKDSDIRVGLNFIMNSRFHQSFTGEPLLQRCRILSADKIDGTTIRFTASTIDFEVVDPGLRFFIIADDNAPDYGSATAEERQQNGYFSDRTLETVNGDPPYLIV